MNETNISYKEIARKCNLSLSTISRAFQSPNLVKPETLKTIIKAITDLGCEVPESMANPAGSTRILAIVPMLDNPFYQEIIKGIQKCIKGQNGQLFILNIYLNDSNINWIIKYIDSSFISGVIVFQQVENNVLSKLCALTHVVQCSEYNSRDDVSAVTIDNVEAIKKVMRHLINSHCKKIALVNFDEKKYKFAELRLKGYMESMNNAGLKIDQNYLLTIPDGQFTTALSAISSMLKYNEKPDAIACTSDIMAVAALKACANEHLKVPDDILVTGFDNIDVASMTTPSITTIHQPGKDIGFTACSQLISMINNPDKKPTKYLLDTELVIRESTDKEM